MPLTSTNSRVSYYFRFMSFGLLTIACLVLAFLNSCNDSSSKKSIFTTPPILLFNGTGVSANDVAAIETILNNNYLSYATVNSSGLNGMSRAQMMHYRLLIIPGGNFIIMGNSLTKATSVNVRQAVQQGLNYFGICAGAFLAGNSAYYNGFNLTSGIIFGFYSAENKGVHKAAVAITDARGITRDQYWEDGPQLSGWGSVIAKYPDGTAVITAGKCGKGRIILTGIHAEARQNGGAI